MHKFCAEVVNANISSLRKLTGPYGTIQDHTGPNRTILQHEGQYGNKWDHTITGLKGTKLDQTETNQTKWDHKAALPKVCQIDHAY